MRSGDLVRRPVAGASTVVPPSRAADGAPSRLAAAAGWEVAGRSRMDAPAAQRRFTWGRFLGNMRWTVRHNVRLFSTSPEAWLVRSFPTETMTKVEDFARFGTLIMPASHGIWLAEFGSSVCALLGLWREVVLRRPESESPSPTSDAFVVFQRERRERPPRLPVARLLLALSLVRKVEVLGEMMAARFCPRLKWWVILVVEALKAAVRLLILVQLRGTTLLYDRLDLRSPPAREVWNGVQGEYEPNPAWRTDLGSLGRAQQLLTACWTDTTVAGAARGARMHACLSMYDNAPTQLPTAASALSVAGEVLYVLRPVIFVGALARVGRESWGALACSFATDALSWSAELLARRQLTVDERTEITRRRWQVWLYLLRAPLFSVTIEAGARSAGAALARLPRWTGGPMLGVAYGWVVELLCYCVTEYYFYTAGS